MVQVVFTESAGGSLQAALSMGKGKYLGGATAVIGWNEDGSPFSEEQIAEETVKMEEEYRKKFENAVPMEGSQTDVFCLALNLSLGDISGDLFGEKRMEHFRALYSIYPEVDSEQELEVLMETYRSSTDKAVRRAAFGEPVRVWYSDNPDEMCGFYHLMSILPPNSHIWAIKLPEFEEFPEKNTIVRYTGWGQLSPEEFNRFLPSEEKISENRQRMLASRWVNLVEENAPVRVVLNGNLASAGEGIYDFYILRELEQQPEVFHEAHLIGKIIGKYQLGIGDSFIHQRICCLIDRGVLKAETEPPEGQPHYHRYLRKIKSEKA